MVGVGRCPIPIGIIRLVSARQCRWISIRLTAAQRAQAISTRATIERLFQKKVSVDYASWRPGDQRIYVSDIRRSAAELDWRPKTSLQDGLGKLSDWVQDLV